MNMEIKFTVNYKDNEVMEFVCNENEISTYEVYNKNGDLIIDTNNYDYIFKLLEKMSNNDSLTYEFKGFDLECYQDIVLELMNQGVKPCYATMEADEFLDTVFMIDGFIKFDNQHFEEFINEYNLNSRFANDPSDIFTRLDFWIEETKESDNFGFNFI